MFVFHFSFQAQLNDIMDQCSGFELWVFSIFTCACVLVQFCTWICKKNKTSESTMHSMSSLQQHGRLREDRDFRGQRQPGDGEHQAGVLWAAAGPGERWLWKGMCGAQEAARKYTWHVHTPTKTRIGLFYLCELLFSSLQVFQVRKVVGAAAGKIFAMKVLKKVLIFIFPCGGRESLVATT